ncbi:MAG: 30S ribosomal protein S14 [Gemmatimonadales bacterium]|nr:30S ribosomal protein S14 [Gemmatimonadales bacterium]
MAKISMVVKNERRQAQARKQAKKRAELKKIIRSPKSSDEQRENAGEALRALPRDGSATRSRNRCAVSGRSRGYIGKFGLSRIAFRDMALRGEIPGVRKASW